MRLMFSACRKEKENIAKETAVINPFGSTIPMFSDASVKMQTKLAEKKQLATA